jgi:hypothetical protein
VFSELIRHVGHTSKQNEYISTNSANLDHIIWRINEPQLPLPPLPPLGPQPYFFEAVERAQLALLMRAEMAQNQIIALRAFYEIYFNLPANATPTQISSK